MTKPEGTITRHTVVMILDPVWSAVRMVSIVRLVYYCPHCVLNLHKAQYCCCLGVNLSKNPNSITFFPLETCRMCIFCDRLCFLFIAPSCSFFIHKGTICHRPHYLVCSSLLLLSGLHKLLLWKMADTYAYLHHFCYNAVNQDMNCKLVAREMMDIRHHVHFTVQ